MKVDELPKGFVGKPIAEIVFYESETRTVRFAIGERNFEYQLPLNHSSRRNEEAVPVQALPPGG